ncbi:MAG: HD-GYP domain-containing protein [Candidatus Methylomirabilia bacterium]
MFEKLRISLFEMVMCFSEALDLVSPKVVDHHKRVAYLAFRIAGEAGFAAEERGTILLAGLLHDLGAVTQQERLEALSFELDFPQIHAERGYQLIHDNDLFSAAAEIIRFHHMPWGDGTEVADQGTPVPFASHVVHLADRIAVLLKCDREILCQSQGIVERIVQGRGTKFAPALVDAFRSLAQNECFWFDAVSPEIGRVLLCQQQDSRVNLSSRQLFDVTRLFSHIIDCRSRFTANHSSGGAAVAERLAGFAGLSYEERGLIEIAGYLHDLGKLAVPTAILEKPGKLTPREFNIVKKHPYDTHRILATVESLATIAKWSSLHHEYINGKGYPFRYSGENLPLGAWIMSVADIFTALSEDRPYRRGMPKADIVRTLEDMARNRLLDDNLVALTTARFETIDAVRRCAQSA